MNHTSYEYTVYLSAYIQLLGKVRIDLFERSDKVKAVWNLPAEKLTQNVIDRANREEGHIKLMVGFIDVVEELLQLNEDIIQDKKQIQITWHAELMSEMDENKIRFDALFKVQKSALAEIRKLKSEINELKGHGEKK